MKSLLFVAATVLAALNTSAAERADSAADELVAKSIAQAESITTLQGQSSAPRQAAEIRVEIEAKQSAWKQRLDSSAGVAELLSGIPAKVLEQARAIAPDKLATAQALKRGVTFEEFLVLVSERNPDVRSAYQNWRASVQRFGQASFLEDLVGQYNAFTRELDTKVGPQTHRPMQGVYPSMLSLKGEVIDLETEIAWLKYLSTLRKTMNTAAKAYFDVQYTAHAIGIVKENRELFKQMVESTRARLEVGNASQADLLRSRSELANLETRIVTLEHDRINGLAKLNSILALAPGAEWGPWDETELDDVTVPANEAVKRALAQNQDLEMARKEAELMPAMVRMAEVEITPRAGPGYGNFSPTQGAVAGPTRNKAAAFPQKPMVSGGGSAMYSANAAYLQELHVRVQQTNEMLALAQDKLEFAAEDADFQLDRAQREQKTLTETVVPDSKQAFDTLRERYSNNATPLIDYLDAGRSYLNNALMLQGARRNHNQVLVDLQDAMGRTASGLTRKQK